VKRKKKVISGLRRKIDGTVAKGKGGPAAPTGGKAASKSENQRGRGLKQGVLQRGGGQKRRVTKKKRERKKIKKIHRTQRERKTQRTKNGKGRCWKKAVRERVTKVSAGGLEDTVPGYHLKG